MIYIIEKNILEYYIIVSKTFQSALFYSFKDAKRIINRNLIFSLTRSIHVYLLNN